MDIARHELIDQLFQAILSLETIEECYEFFEDGMMKVSLSGKNGISEAVKDFLRLFLLQWQWF